MIEIVRVIVLDPPALAACGIVCPRPRDRYQGHTIDIAGWAVGGACPAVAVEVMAQDIVLRRVLLDGNDPKGPPPQTAGFAVSIPVVGMTSVELRLVAVLRDGTRTPFATLVAERRWRTHDSSVGAPLVSVIIPSYNQAPFLADAIESVLAQSYPHVEIIVIDDGSHDNTAAVASRFPRVRYIRQPNRGLAPARNAGLLASRGSYVVFLDADDRLLPAAVVTGLLELAAYPECAFAVGEARHITFDGVPIPTATSVIRANHYAELLRNCFVGMPGVVMFRRIVFSYTDGFNTSFGSSADHELYLRIARDYPIRRYGRVVAEYRRHGANMTRDPVVNLRDRVRVLRVQRRALRGRNVSDRAAYLHGLAFGRRYYGDPLVTDVVSDVWSRRWRRAVRGMWMLLAYYPRGAVHVACHLFRHAVVARPRGPVSG
jgi:glycosyltransferase involved in cell wall biosynthesis